MAYDSIRQYEGFRDKAYRDSGGKWTIGYGQTELNGRPVQAGDMMSHADADKAWGAQVAPYAARARQIMPNANAGQHEALTSLIYNYGIDSPRVARLGQMLNGGDQEAAKQYWLASNTVKGQPNEGLTKRRAAEWAMFSGQGGGGSAPAGKPVEGELSPFQRLSQHLAGDKQGDEAEQADDGQSAPAALQAAPTIPAAEMAQADYRATPFMRFMQRLGG